MGRERDLTEGDISRTLIRLALPIMGTSFINMLYNLTDTMWLGRLSTSASASVGAASFFTWFGSGFIMISQVGVGIGVAQSYGRDDHDAMTSYISNGFKLDIFLAILYALFLYSFRYSLMGFFNIENQAVINDAADYLQIISIGLLFHFMNPVISAVFNAVGNSGTPFKINTVGLFTNIILDPVLIFGLGPFPAMGVRGAAIATSLAQMVVTGLFLLAISKNRRIFGGVKILSKPDFDYISPIAKKGFPAFIQTSVHSSINMMLAKILSAWGEGAIAVQSIGSQIESLSWMTAEGFSSAMTAFIGQNFGAKDYDRVKDGYRKGTQIVATLGILVSILFISQSENIFKLFTPKDPVAIAQGASYLRILGYSQLFVCLEISAIGGFSGIGRTALPSLIGAFFNALRIPVALKLSSTALGLDGVWWSVSGSSIIKGTLITGLCIYVFRNKVGIDEGYS